MPSVQRNNTLADHQQRMRRVLCHIQHNLDASLSLSALAEIAHFSPFHFHRVFRGMVGESVQQHVRRLRLERAAMRLKHTQTPITQIAFEAGYEAHEAFTRAFSNGFGRSPSAFRQEPGPARLSCPSGVHFSLADELSSARFAEQVLTQVEVVELPDMRVLYERHVGPYHEVGKTWQELLDGAARHCLFGKEHSHIGICYDDPEVTEPNAVHYDACVAVDGDFVPEANESIQTIAGGRFARATHVGPYETLSHTYGAIFGVWLLTQDLSAADAPCLEFYINDPESSEPEDLLTDVYVRLL